MGTRLDAPAPPPLLVLAPTPTPEPTRPAAAVPVLMVRGRLLGDWNGATLGALAAALGEPP
jgi:hypothetical protein